MTEAMQHQSVQIVSLANQLGFGGLPDPGAHAVNIARIQAHLQEAFCELKAPCEGCATLQCPRTELWCPI